MHEGDFNAEPRVTIVLFKLTWSLMVVAGGLDASLRCFCVDGATCLAPSACIPPRFTILAPLSLTLRDEGTAEPTPLSSNRGCVSGSSLAKVRSLMATALPDGDDH